MYSAKLLLFSALLLPEIVGVSNLIRIACNRNPTAPFCPAAKARSQTTLVAPPDSLYLKDDSSRRNSPAGRLIDDLEANAPNEGDFGDEANTTPRSPFAPEEDSVTAYCKKYRKHNSFYCQKSKLRYASENLVQFCSSYFSNCKDFLSTAASETEEESGRGSSTGGDGFQEGFFPQTGKQPTSGIFEKFQPKEKQQVVDKELEMLKKKRPCTADCDQRIWKHCTHDCKCDHDYPYVQKFCNPPPLPMFLMTCRLWYTLCPKYEVYHYASQFIYSKAEKGKVLPGTNVNAASAIAQQEAFLRAHG